LEDGTALPDLPADPGASGDPGSPPDEDVETDTYTVGPPCTEDDEEQCTITNEHGSCPGEIVCLGERGLAPCDARTPAAEVCNAVDDDCDGETDEELALCDCGDGTCAAEGGETVALCPCDCRECGDEICSPCGESPATCEEDCCRTPLGPSTCGDGYCLGYGCGEKPEDCPEDCGKDCGNGECERGENPFGCPEDCKRGVCGNDVCEPTDGGPVVCPADCSTTCGDCACDKGESWVKCPIDCGFCGDGVCSDCPNFDESPETCALDCCVPLGEEDRTCDGVDDDCDGAVDEESCDDGDPCTTDICEGGETCSHTVAEGLCGVSASVTPDGESTLVDPVGGLSIVVPEGAVSEEVEISAEPLPEQGGQPVEGEQEGVVVLSAWSFEPDGQTFDPPVQITLPVRGEPLPAGSLVLIATLDEESGLWLRAEMLDGSEVFGRVAEDGLSVSFAVDHFSAYAFARAGVDCQPACGERECGSDGCGGACGECLEGLCWQGACCVPRPEDCNGEDDDCDGEIDDGAEAVESCVDENACTTHECSEGECRYAAVECDDEETCTVDVCNPAEGCVFTPKVDGAACDTGGGPSSGLCVSGACELDTVAPEPPLLSGVEPSSPSAIPSPMVSGQAEPLSTVRLYLDADCAGDVAAEGRATEDGAFTLQVAVAENGATAIHATATDRAGNTSTCSEGLTYTHDDVPPFVDLSGTEPASPAGSATPVVSGTTEPGSTVSLYTDSLCREMAAATGEADAATGEFAVEVRVGENSTTVFYVTAMDRAGNESECPEQALEYTHSSLPCPAAPCSDEETEPYVTCSYAQVEYQTKCEARQANDCMSWGGILEAETIIECHEDCATCHCECLHLWNPVCGSDGVTYANLCVLKCADGNPTLAYEGTCEPDCVPEGGTVPTVPDAPSCCDGLEAICNFPAPDDGTCPDTPCTGEAICAACGDGTCGPFENRCTCPADCHCGDGVCEAARGESLDSCPTDCAAVCGNCACEPEESMEECPVDCAACGDDYCGCNEGGGACPTDCGVCGDGVCAVIVSLLASDKGPQVSARVPEDATNCPQDCP